jgi:hypothetical protein
VATTQNRGEHWRVVSGRSRSNHPIKTRSFQEEVEATPIKTCLGVVVVITTQIKPSGGVDGGKKERKKEGLSPKAQ